MVKAREKMTGAQYSGNLGLEKFSPNTTVGDLFQLFAKHGIKGKDLGILLMFSKNLRRFEVFVAEPMREGKVRKKEIPQRGEKMRGREFS